jgi:hypothetical protein
MKTLFLILAITLASFYVIANNTKSLTYQEEQEHVMGCLAALSMLEHNDNTFEVMQDVCEYVLDVRRAQFGDAAALERVMMTIEELKKKRLEYLRQWVLKRLEQKRLNQKQKGVK